MNIDKDIPVPVTKRARQGKNIKLMQSMEVGDSVFFEGELYFTVYNRFYNVSKRQGKHIVVRPVEGGVRMWRDK